MNLTFEQEEQQQLVDNAVHSYLCDKAGNPDLPWDIEKIAEVREEWQEIICDRLNMTTPFQFYPWVLDDDKGDEDEGSV